MKMITIKNIKNSLSTTEDAQNFIKNTKQRFRLAEKSLIETLMTRPTTMKYDGAKGMLISLK